MAWDSVARMVASDPVKRHADIAQVMDSHIAWATQTSFGMQVDHLPAVVATRRLLAETVTQLDWATTDGPLPRWLSQPRVAGGTLDWMQLLEWVVDAQIGYGYAPLVVRRAFGVSWRITPYHPASVQPTASTNGPVGVSWHVGGEPVPEVPAQASQIVDGRDYLVPIRMRASTARPWGTTPLIDAVPSLQGAATTEHTGAAIFDSGTYQGGILETDQDLSPRVAEAFQSRWVEARKGGKIPVLANGLRYRQEVSSAVDLQLLEARSFNQSQVFMLFGIPPDYMGSSLQGGQSSFSYSNSRQNDQRYIRNAVAPLVGNIADGLSSLLPPGRSDAEAVRVTWDTATWETTVEDPSANPSD